MQEEKEKDLINRLTKPETQLKAFEDLVNEYSQKLYWQIRKMVISHQDTDDVLQNVFIKVWTSLETFRGDSKLSTWLYRIAVNESISFINREKAKRNLSIDDEDSFLISKLESDSDFDGDELELKLHKAILSLPERQRLVFNMRYFDELKYSEIADILDLSEGALKASFHHAKSKIEEFLSKED